MTQESFHIISQELGSLAVFRELLDDPVLQKLLAYLQSPSVAAYSAFVAALYARNYDALGPYVQALCANSANICVRTIGAGAPLSATMAASLHAELEILQRLCDLRAEDLRKPLAWDRFLPAFRTPALDLKGDYLYRMQHIAQYGYGIFTDRRMFYLEKGRIVPVQYPDETRLSDLIAYEAERAQVLQNTRALLAGKPAANILLTGDAGTGKSSTIKAVVNELWQNGLRIIEVRKDQLCDIPGVLNELARNPLKFILFIDDLSFAAGDDSFNALKAVLEGSVAAKSRNVVIYATSNRRHVVKERFSDRDGDDVHRNETLQEMASLSERFGLHITFQKPDKATYLRIVRSLAAQHGLEMDNSRLEAKAEQYALRRGGRSARLARQLVEELLSATACS